MASRAAQNDVHDPQQTFGGVPDKLLEFRINWFDNATKVFAAEVIEAEIMSTLKFIAVVQVRYES